MENQKEPILEEYGLDIFSYLKHKKRIEDLIEVKESLSYSFLKALLTISLPIFILFSIFGSNLNIFPVLLVSLVPLAWFDDFKKFFNNRNEEYKKIEKEIQICKQNHNINNFDTAISNFCKYKLSGYYTHELYRKRAGREDGAWFFTMIREADKIAEITGQFTTYNYYREYLYKRFGYLKELENITIFNFSTLISPKKQPISLENNNKRLETVIVQPEIREIKYKEDNFEDINIVENFDKKKNEEKNFLSDMLSIFNDEIDNANNSEVGNKHIINTIDVIPPYKKYSTPRKIDWESINKNKTITGMKGEEIVMEIEQNYLKSIDREDLAVKVRHASKMDGDGLGYDILSFFLDGQEKYIEVKSSKNSNSNSFNITDNELDFMKENKDNYQIYRLFNVGNTDGELPTLKIDTARDILDFKKITPSQYVVKM